MENEQMSESSSMMTYVVGAVLLIAVVAGAWYFKSKGPTSMTTPTDQTQPVATPTPGPITELGCDVQYINTKIGFPEYYLSVEGGDVSTAKSVTCDFTVKTEDNKVLGKASAEGELTANATRGGSTFRCTTKAVALTPNVLTTVEVSLKDDLKKTASCSAPFTFPSP
jgi:hypothetical protein